MDRDTFYHSGMFAVIPMDFYYPGKGKSGDLPPRKGFAEKWHVPILANLPNIELTILIGQYAQKYYLPENELNVTETVRHFRDFLPHFLLSVSYTHLYLHKRERLMKSLLLKRDLSQTALLVISPLETELNGSHRIPLY